jgi:hypothetical protein
LARVGSRLRWESGVLALAILGGSAPNVEAAMGPNPVVVVNTPLPVSGTVTANQGGTWTVKASPTLEAHHEAIEVASDLFVETTPQSRRLFITRLTVVLDASVPGDPPSPQGAVQRQGCWRRHDRATQTPAATRG